MMEEKKEEVELSLRELPEFMSRSTQRILKQMQGLYHCF